MRQQIIERAHILADMGLKLIPLLGKAPCLKSWPKLATSDKAKIDHWFNHPAPERNLGLVLGSVSQNLVCVDIDPRNGGLEWLEQYPQLWEDCQCIEKSGKMDGGAHFFFKAPDVYLKTRVLAKGVDFLANKKQVVISPSIHPETGFPYIQTKGDLSNPFCYAEIPQYITDMLSQALTLDEYHERAPVKIKDHMTHSDRVHIMKLLEQCNPEKGRHYQLGGWVVDAVGNGMQEEEIIQLGNEWIAEKGGREPQEREVHNLIKSARIGLENGDLYLRERIDPESIISKFEEKSVETVEATKEDYLKSLKPSPDSSGNWTGMLRVSQSGELKKESFNVRLILENDSRVMGKIKKNEIQQTLVKLVPMPWDDPSRQYPKYGYQWTDEDTASLKHWISSEYGAEISKQNIEDALLAYGQANSFHPIRDWLLTLEWDGVARLDSWLHNVARTENSDYNAIVGRILVMGLVARIVRPGVKFDDVIVLEGIQGCGKSTLCKELVGEDFYCETPGDISSNQTIENSLGHWLIELPEIESYLFRYKSSELKRFLSTSIDTIRLPYGRRSQRIPRQFLMVGTTNKAEYLVDTTGNRRYLPVKCGAQFFAFDWLAENREQLFAEALQKFKNGESFFQDNKLASLAVREQSKRMLSDPWTNKIAEFMTSLVSGDGATVGQIWEKCFLQPSSSLDLKKSGRIVRGLVNLGYSEEKKSGLWRPVNKKGIDTVN